MAIQDKTTLKGYFKTGDQPTQAQFEDLIDSQLNLTDGGTVTGELSVENNLSFASAVAAGNITASGNISSSGIITGLTGSFSHIQGNSPLNIDLSAGQIRGISQLNFESANLFGNPTFHGDINIFSQSALLDAEDNSIIRSNDVVGPGGLITFGDEFNARTRIQGLSVRIVGPVTMSSTISSSGTIFANNAQFGSSTVFINGPAGHITASGNISASGTVISNTINTSTINTPINPVSRINALTASIAHFVPPNASFQAEDNLGNVLDFTFSGSALFTTIPDSHPAGHQRVEIAAGAISASGTVIAKDFHLKNGKMGINTGNTPPNPINSPHLEVVGDISASGKITGLTGSFGRLEGLSPITFGDDIIVNGDITASNEIKALTGIIGNGFIAVPSESQMTLNHGAPNADYIYKSSPHGTIGINNEHAGTVNGHMALYAPNSSIRMAFSPTDVSGPINGVSQSFATSASLSAIRFQNLPTTKEQAAQIGTGSLWLSGSDATGTSKYLMVFVGQA